MFQAAFYPVAGNICQVYSFREPFFCDGLKSVFLLIGPFVFFCTLRDSDGSYNTLGNQFPGLLALFAYVSQGNIRVDTKRYQFLFVVDAVFEAPPCIA